MFSYHRLENNNKIIINNHYMSKNFKNKMKKQLLSNINIKVIQV